MDKKMTGTVGRETELLHALNAAAASLQRSAHSEESVYAAVREQIVGLGLRGALAVRSDDGEQMVMRAVAVPDAVLTGIEKLTSNRVEGYSITLGDVELFRQVLETGQPVFTSDMNDFIGQLISKTARHLLGAVLRLIGQPSGIVAPLVLDGAVRGVMTVAGNGLRAQDVPAFEAFTNHIAVALDNARLFASMQQAEEHYRRLFESATEGIILIDPATALIFSANPRALELTGFSEAELLKLSVTQLHPPRLAEEARRLFGIARDQGRAVFELPMLRRDGREFFAHVSATAFEVGGQSTIQVVFQDITERVQSKEALRESEAKLRAIIEHSTDSIYIKDKNSRYLMINPTGARDAGYSVEEILGKTDDELWDEVDGREIRRTDLYVLESGKPYTFERRRQIRGVEHVFLTTKFPYVLDEGELLGIVGISRDISERVRAEDSEREQRALAEALRDSAATLNSTLKVDEVFDRILANVAQVASYDLATIMLVESGIARTMRRRYEDDRTIDKSLTSRPYVVSETANLRRMAETGQPVVIFDTHADAEWIKRPDTMWMRSYVGIPIRIRGEVIGFLGLYGGTTGVFTHAHAERLLAFANQAAVAIENAQLFEAAEQRASELEAVFHSSLSLAGNLALETVLNTVLEAALKLMPGSADAHIFLYNVNVDGADRLEFGAALWADGHSGKARSEPRKNGFTYSVARTGEAILVSYMKDHPLFEDAPPEWNGSIVGLPLKIGERVIGVMNVFHSQPGAIDEGKIRVLRLLGDQLAIAIENARLFEETDQLRSFNQNIVQSMEECILLEDATMRITFVNPKAVELTGYTRDELLDMYAPDLVIPEQRVISDTEFAKRPQGVSSRYELELLTKDGRRVPVIVGARPLFEDGQFTGVLSVFTDITEHKQSEAALRESEQRYRELLDVEQRLVQESALLDQVRVALARELDLPIMFRTVVEAIAETFGYTHVGLYMLEGAALRLQHQVGYESVIYQIPITQGINGRVVRSGESVLVEDVSTEPEFLKASDETVSEVCVPLVDEGKVVGTLNVESTGEMILTEDDLRLMKVLGEHISIAIGRARLYTEARSNEELFRLIFEHAPYGMSITTLGGQFLRVNQSYCDTIGYTADELLTKKFVNITHPDDMHINLSQQSQLVRGEIPHYRVEKRFIAKDGKIVYTMLQAALIRDSNDRPFRVIAQIVDITKSKLAEEALRDSEERFRQLVENIDEVLWISTSSNDKLLYISPGYEKIWGRSSKALMSREHSFLDLIHESDRERVSAAHTRQAIDDYDIEYRLVRDDGTIRWIRDRSFPIKDKSGKVYRLAGITEDITTRKRVEEALRESENSFRSVFENSPIGILTANENGVVTDINDAYLRIVDALGERERIVGVFNLLDADIFGAAGIREYFKQVYQGQPFATEIAITGEENYVYYQATPLVDSQGNVSGCVVIAEDISERKRAEELLRQTQKLESLGILAGGVAHDFNNLLVAILGQTSLALHILPENSPARANIGKAVKAAERAAELTRQMLAYSGKGQFEVRPIDLNVLIQDNLHLFEVAVLKNVRLRSQFASALPLVEADSGQMQQLTMNLILNAAEAIGERPGTVTVITSVEELHADFERHWQFTGESLAPGHYVKLEVQDDGCGMDEETLSKIFDPFFTTKFTGRGLGLAAVLGIVRGHKGGLEVDSKVGEGTTFRILLPATSAKLSAPPAPEENFEHLDGLILVIDDEKSVRDAVADILAVEGLQVMTAHDGETGIDLYQKKSAEINLVLLDLSMPGLSGEETLNELQKIDPGVRVLLTSGYSQEDVVGRFEGAGLAGFIQKPYTANALVNIIRQHIAHASRIG